MDEKTFHEKLLDLIEQIKRFPEAKRESLEMVAGALGKKYEDLRESLVLLQDTLDSLRLNVKYLLFDLEATKKENTALRKKQEEQGNNK
ncbi:MAG: transcriptional regulator [Planctomycetota bacterium]